MIRKIKTLGIAVVAVLALSAVVASAASAANFTASSYPTAGTATSNKGNDDFKTEAGGIECHTHFAVAALNAPSEALTVTPTYTECSGFGFLNSTYNMNGCDYVLYVSGRMDINCPAGKAIVITSGTCETTIPGQLGLKNVELSNGTSGITMKMNVGGLAYTVTKDGFGCPFSGTGAKTGATYTQNSAIQISSTNGATIDIG
jgi:hypothetical protein